MHLEEVSHSPSPTSLHPVNPSTSISPATAAPTNVNSPAPISSAAVPHLIPPRGAPKSIASDDVTTSNVDPLDPDQLTLPDLQGTLLLILLSSFLF